MKYSTVHSSALHSTQCTENNEPMRTPKMWMNDGKSEVISPFHHAPNEQARLFKIRFLNLLHFRYVWHTYA